MGWTSFVVVSCAWKGKLVAADLETQRKEDVDPEHDLQQQGDLTTPPLLLPLYMRTPLYLRIMCISM